MEIKQYTYPEKISKTNVIFYKVEPGRIRLLINDNKMDFDNLKSAINTYLTGVNYLKRHDLIKINQSGVNSRVRIKICGLIATVGFAFRLYNHIVKTFNLEMLTFEKKFYNQEIDV